MAFTLFGQDPKNIQRSRRAVLQGNEGTGIEWRRRAWQIYLHSIASLKSAQSLLDIQELAQLESRRTPRGTSQWKLLHDNIWCSWVWSRSISPGRSWLWERSRWKKSSIIEQSKLRHKYISKKLCKDTWRQLWSYWDKCQCGADCKLQRLPSKLSLVQTSCGHWWLISDLEYSSEL